MTTDFNLLSDPTDYGNAQAVYHFHGDKFAQVDGWGLMHYNGQHWTIDGADAQLRKGVVDTLKLRGKAALDAEKEVVQKKCITDSRNISNAIREFLGLPEIRRAPTDFDADPWVLNVSNGVVDLRTGRLREHQQGELFTYCLPVAYHDQADHSAFSHFLDQVVMQHGTDEQVRDYVQMSLGYSITGQTNEECLFYLWGLNGRNGKGTLIETVQATMDDTGLSKAVSFEVFTQRQNDPQGFNLAPLHRARFVTASESKQTHKLDESIVKRVTGRDMINASFKGKTPFEYRPQFKLWLQSNFKPKGNPDDTAFWNRIRLIVFPHSFNGNEDKGLKDRMTQPKYLQGFLKYLVDGARMFYNDPNGLQTPQVFIDTLSEARNESDSIGRWLDDNDRKGDPETEWMEAKATYADYKLWCEENEENAVTVRRFRESLEAKSYPKNRIRTKDNAGNSKTIWTYMGIKGDGFAA